MAVSDHQVGQPEVSLTDLLIVMIIMMTRMMMVKMTKMMIVIIISSTDPLANIIRKRSQRTKAMDTWSWLDQDEDEEER